MFKVDIKIVSYKKYYKPIQITSLLIYRSIVFSNNMTTTQIIFKSNKSLWYRRVYIITLLFFQLYKNKRYKILYMNFILSIFFYENTTPLKSYTWMWLKYSPLKTHKRFARRVASTAIATASVLQIEKILTRMQLIFKGKLGLRGDNKKKKIIYSVNQKLRYNFNKVHFFDGIGSSSRFGHTFLRIRYTHTYGMQ